MTYHKPFDDKEYHRRLNTVKALMVDRSLDLIICQDPANMTWLTGFDGWSFYVPQAVLVHTDLQLPLWFGRTQDVRSAAMTTGLPDSNIVGFSEHLFITLIIIHLMNSALLYRIVDGGQPG